MPSNQGAQIKSLQADWPAYVTFKNRTNVPVDIAWVNYQGKLVRYCRELGPGDNHHQNTYVSHPWVAWSSDTQDKLLVGHKFVFEPQPYGGEQVRTVVYIDRPVLPLLKLCIKKIRLLVGADQVEDLEIPKDLFKVLKKRHNVEFRDVARQNRQ